MTKVNPIDVVDLIKYASEFDGVWSPLVRSSL